MNCTYHAKSQISCICVAPHKCQCKRKLCAQCIYEHGVDAKQAVPINIFQELLLVKLNEYKLDETSELIKQKLNFKSMLSETLSAMKNIWEQLQETITQIFDMIEIQNKLYLNIVNENANIAESSETHLEALVRIFQGETLKNWTNQKNSYLKQLDKVKDWWSQEIKAFNEKMKKQMKEFLNSNKNPPVQKQEQVQNSDTLASKNTFTFSKIYKYPSCEVSQNGRMYYNNALFYSCLCDQAIPQFGIVRFAFFIHNVINDQTMVGIGAREIISKNGYLNLQDAGKGAYLIMSSGYCFSHHQQEKYHASIPFKFTNNDIIIIEVVIQQKYIKWIKKSTKQSYLLEINPNYQYYPCINGPGKVEIMDDISLEKQQYNC
ncbi:unnamed protein product [Paramecium octaurelia]|uniref:Uncharacterized protein n=1 Tax=Paramecium octaurelia TaxID=43137 RepID=A0A8S1V322_PAROT|nr:unnamed protein product [Paramecium octaurelia]